MDSICCFKGIIGPQWSMTSTTWNWSQSHFSFKSFKFCQTSHRKVILISRPRNMWPLSHDLFKVRSWAEGFFKSLQFFNILTGVGVPVFFLLKNLIQWLSIAILCIFINILITIKLIFKPLFLILNIFLNHFIVNQIKLVLTVVIWLRPGEPLLYGSHSIIVLVKVINWWPIFNS